MPAPQRIFLLSPAKCSGQRASYLFNDLATFTLARQLRTPAGAPLGEIFAFLSGLYFRGKLAYAGRFANVPETVGGSWIITSNRGLLSPQTPFGIDDLRALGQVPIDPADERYRHPLQKSLRRLLARSSPSTSFILLGSIATGKYGDVLEEVLGPRLLFPEPFIGRGDMSRGGLMLRCVRSGEELNYIPIEGALRRGHRPPKLEPFRG